LKYIIDRVERKERVGVCWDTCHLYTAGYDIKNNLEAVIKEFEEKIGLKKLWVIHVNDSLNELGAKIDRHENIGYGKIGFEALKRIVYHPKFDGKIKLLETPRKREEFQEEIRLLKGQLNP
jgi:deoxyribonuclease-4